MYFSYKRESRLNAKKLFLKKPNLSTDKLQENSVHTVCHTAGVRLEYKNKINKRVT